MTSVVTVLAFCDSANGGAPVPGLVPSFVFFNRLSDNSAITPQPAIVNLGGGKYSFAYDPTVSGDAVWKIDGGASLTVAADRYQTGTVQAVQANQGASGSRTIVAASALAGSLQDASGTTTTSDVVLSAAPSKYLLLQHVDTSGTIAFNFGAAAVINGAGSIMLQPGQMVTMEGNFVATNALHVIGSALGLKFTVKYA
jgi:hypothetical protein